MAIFYVSVKQVKKKLATRIDIVKRQCPDRRRLSSAVAGRADLVHSPAHMPFRYRGAAVKSLAQLFFHHYASCKAILPIEKNIRYPICLFPDLTWACFGAFMSSPPTRVGQQP